MNKHQEALDSLYQDATNGEPLYVKQKHIKAITEYRDELQELVDKATPKKPVKRMKIFETDYRYKLSICECGDQNHEDDNYCSHCGQAIDWSE